MDTFKPIVLTSRRANEDFNKIKSLHTDILRGIQDQSMKVAQFNMQKSQEKQMADEQNKNFQMESQKTQADAEAKRMDAENKRRELDIKAQALTL